MWLFAAGALAGALATYLHMKRVMQGALEWAGKEYIRVAGERDRANDRLRLCLELEGGNGH